MVAYKGKPKSTHPELEYMARVKELPCCICLPGEQISVTQVHHITDGGRRLGNHFCLPLCATHHEHVHLLRHGEEQTLWSQVNETLSIEREWPGTKVLARPLLRLKLCGGRRRSSSKLPIGKIMGQYHKLINLDKKEYVHAHRIGNGLKLMEQCGFEKSTASALWLLLAASNGRGGGDANEHPLIGTWAGDRIAVIGDYAETNDIPGVDAKFLYSDADHYKDISDGVRDMLDKEFGGEPAKA